jgi:mono/diheme cytochrome c family protein
MPIRMKIFRMLSRVGLGAIFLLTAITELVPPPASPAPSTERPHTRPLVIRTALITLLAAGLLFVLGSLLFIESGWYNLAADTPHFAPVRWTLMTMRDRAVRFHSRGVVVPDLGDPSLAAHGFALYRKNCQPCHGAPGEAGEQMGRGINPKPPRLSGTIHRWTDSQLYWIVSRGLKMSGMPAFAPRLSNTDCWNIVAFLRRLVWFAPSDYRRLAAEVDKGIKPADWPPRDDVGFGKLDRANLRRGRDLVRSYGCVTCHEIAGFRPAYVGPPLVGLAERQYLAGMLVNVPSNAVDWITNPKQFKPATAMPHLGVPLADAFDIAAYLYSSGDPKRIEALRRPGGLHR